MKGKYRHRRIKQLYRVNINVHLTSAKADQNWLIDLQI